MDELAGRLTALDPDAGAAVQAIAYFDRLAEARAGLEALVRGAAVLAGCPARLIDTARRVRIRVEPDGKRRDTDTPPDSSWLSRELAPDISAALWLERTGPPSMVDAVILERASGILRQILDRTRGRAPLSPSDDPALLETVLDSAAPDEARMHAAHALGLTSGDPTVRVRTLAVPGGDPRILPAHSGERLKEADLPAGRVGIGPAVPVLDLPQSWAVARTALRFTGEGTAGDPGERVMYAEDLGDILLLANLVGSDTGPPPDARALDAALADAPWMLATLGAVATTQSRRAAAAKLNIHHSTLQARLARAEGLLGWPVHTLTGHLRLQLALLTRQLARGEDHPLQP
ncbi:helix-turn-helix domain-containing protein [Streptomyces sp. NPDC101152]|uniref:helix-turn-helix domain-containing protein n=1 Tax=Streptomyces sp. NPDC101152 TaxID=3366116 RepID=UPI003811AE11